jgi:multisubunit Na+/H+ antiporter MnhG subunit
MMPKLLIPGYIIGAAAVYIGVSCYRLAHGENAAHACRPNFTLIIALVFLTIFTAIFSYAVRRSGRNRAS